LKLARQKTPTQPANGLGIHGTNDEASVTKSLSSGCIRMRNADVEILTSIVPSKTRVTIKN
jgi:lipoprotein-anchoring transpeptidase ErfK/SrfK